MLQVYAYASAAALSGVDIKENNKGGMDVILKLDGKAEIKKSFAASDVLNIYINSAAPAENADIIYENTSNIKNVVIQKKNSSKTAVMIEGKNIANADVYIKHGASDTLIPVKSGNFLSFNDKTAVFSAAALFIFLFMMSSSNRRIKERRRLNRINNSLNSIKAYNDTVSPRVYNEISGCASTPDDFVINRYLNEKMRKAG